MITPIRALARGAWTEQFNQGWRFSRGKLGFWLWLLQVGVAALLLWRLKPAPGFVPLLVPGATVATQGVFGAFVMGLLRGREDLYGKSVLRTLHVSPTSGVSILMGITLAGLPQRLFGSLLVAAVIGWLLPAGGLWWTIPLLWPLALLSSLVGYSAALLALVGWVRVTPRSLALMWGVAVMIGLNLIIILLGLVILAVPVSALAAGIQTAAPWLLGGIGSVVGLPGLVMGIWVALRPERAGGWYREAYLNMQELADGRRRMRASRWPRVLAGAAGALQARLWRELWLNWFTWVRFALMLAVFGTVIWRRQSFTGAASRSPALVVIGSGLFAALGAFGEVSATVGGSDGPNIGLSMVAGVRAGEVVKAKWVACLPLAMLSAASTWVIAITLERPGLSLSMAAGCIALGFSVIATAGGLFDLDPDTEVTEREVPDILRAMLEQNPRKSGGMIGYFGGLVFTSAAVWLCQRLPQAVLPLAIGCAALAHFALVASYRHLKRLGM